MTRCLILLRNRLPSTFKEVNLLSNHIELSGKKVFVTGHTGFTGSWASIWLDLRGAEVFGYSLEPETNPNLFTEAKVGEVVNGVFADIRDFERLRSELGKFQPDLVLHLAAQPLVRKSYRIPRETFEINAQGTANVLEAARLTPSVRGVLCITTDKVYKNLEKDYEYVESDELGGKDPYSASKSAAELIISGYRTTLRGQGIHTPIIAVARGGNIVGGGDWSEDRLIPDFIRAHESGEPLILRYPNSTRPWQHVISLVEGYLTILSGMLREHSSILDQAFNLGPIESSQFSVSDVIELLSTDIPEVNVLREKSDLPEAGKLGLNSNLAVTTFAWRPRWSTQRVIHETATWYLNVLQRKSSAYHECKNQIVSWDAS
jgi:CDP-glucose 4,6-dehydratase